jgi:hypothetical protein
MNAPHRHDLDTTSCINNQVKVFNWKLLKKMKMYDSAKVMEIHTLKKRTLYSAQTTYEQAQKTTRIHCYIRKHKINIRTELAPPMSLKRNTLDTKCDNELEKKEPKPRHLADAENIQ